MSDIISSMWWVLIFAYGLLFGGIGGAWLFNDWFKRSLLWRFGMSKKGFLLVLQKGRYFTRHDFDTRSEKVSIGDKEFTIDQDSVYTYQSIPVAIANTDHSPTVRFHDMESGVKKWLDPTQMHAFIVRLKDMAEAKMLARYGAWKDVALILAVVFAAACVIGVYLLYKNDELLLSMTSQTLDYAKEIATKFR